MRPPKTVDSDRCSILSFSGVEVPCALISSILILAEPGVGKRGSYCRNRRRSIRLGTGTVEVVGALAAAAHDAEDFRRREPAHLQQFQHKRG